ncbi:MAG: FG-GAP-like repeat-containing protein [Verrucomicrobiota bacterium]|nr:FG-GAP-like repeat-containing protein [Verrucomicrobiota bacterium]
MRDEGKRSRNPSRAKDGDAAASPKRKAGLPSNRTILGRVFPFILGAAWLQVGILAVVQSKYIGITIAITCAAALWAGRHRPLVWRLMAIVALVYPGWLLLVHPSLKMAQASTSALAVQRPNMNEDDAVVSALVANEETLLNLSRKMAALSRGLLDLGLPGPAEDAQETFAPSVTVVDLGPAPALSVSNSPMFDLQQWPVVRSSKRVAKVDLWRPLLDSVSYFDSVRLRLTDGRHPNGDMWRFESDARFEAVASMKSGEWRSFFGKIKLSWERQKIESGGAGDWQICTWKTEEMRWNATPRRLFTEALDAALRPPDDPQKLRRSLHYEATVRFYKDGMKKMPHPYFAPISVNQKEGIAVADVNGDGFDDIYITVRLGKNMLLINHGDGTFTEEASSYGLDLPGHTTCAIFADFDNDGDIDVMLGRSLLRTSYLENKGGWFYQHPIPKFMPMAVISMSAADYNNDGLLDIYLCTYRPAAPSGSGGGYAKAAKEADFDWPDEFFSPEMATEFRRRVAAHSRRHGVTVLDQIGPPNVLLVNRGGGRFEPAPENSIVGVWRNSLQATWCDYNEDGRPDLYVPHDWGLNMLFRNDGPAGFTDVTAEAGLTCYGFSMGASFADYDHDGREDLYVSNMYSDAGRRITARIPGLNPLFADSAYGNFLYHKEPNGKFKQVAGLEPPAMAVKRIGWSWGGCFADFDNDSYPDIYVMSGYFTAPRELASGIDLESNLWRTMVRADENLARPTFRFSPEWKRTPPPDNLGPEIDARMAGVERRGERILVHSLQPNERNRCFANRNGRSFVDIAGLSGLDNQADSRGFALLDYDRDGWLDLALVNANLPLFNLYHNEMPAAGIKGGMIAVRFVGGNRTPTPSKEYACRDGFGARVTVDLGTEKFVREHRCGEGWSTQHSATMHIGIGARDEVAAVTVRWPSGKTCSTQHVPEGTLLTVYENQADSPTGQAFVSKPYRVKQPSVTPQPPVTAKPVFPVRTLDTAAKPARLRVYATFATSSPSAVSDLPLWRHLKDVLGADGLDIVAIPIDEADDNPRLGAYAQQHKPPCRLVNIPPIKRADARSAFAKALGQEPPTPSSVVTDDTGRILFAQPGVPAVSELRKALASLSENEGAPLSRK